MDWVGNNKKAIAIIRTSSAQQEGNTSHDTQEFAAIRYCKEVDLHLVKIIKIVESASTSERRKKYSSAIEEALAEGLRHVVFLTYDREARNLTDNEQNENHVRADRMVLHYTQEGKVLHKDSPDSDFFVRDVNSVAAKQYSRTLSTRVRHSTVTKAKSGWYPGSRPPQGYYNKKLLDESGKERRRGAVIALDPNETARRQVLREFELRGILNLSFPEIRKQIVREGLIPLDKIKNYHIGAIEYRLKNKFYNGYFMWQGNTYKGLHELFIPEDLFWKTQETFGIKSPHIRKSKGVFGGGWLRCATVECGCHVVYDPKTKIIEPFGEQKVFHYYHCTNGKRIHPTMKGMTTTEGKIFDQFEQAVDSITITDEVSRQIADALNEAQVKAKKALNQELGSYKDALQLLEVQEDRAYDHKNSGVLDDAAYRRQIDRIRQSRAHYTDLLAKATFSIHDAGMETAKTILELATNAKSLWKTRSPEERRNFLDKLLSNQVLDGTTIRYDLKKPFAVLAEMTRVAEWRPHHESNMELTLRKP